MAQDAEQLRKEIFGRHKVPSFRAGGLWCVLILFVAYLVGRLIGGPNALGISGILAIVLLATYIIWYLIRAFLAHREFKDALLKQGLERLR